MANSTRIVKKFHMATRMTPGVMFKGRQYVAFKSEETHAFASLGHGGKNVMVHEVVEDDEYCGLPRVLCIPMDKEPGDEDCKPVMLVERFGE